LRIHTYTHTHTHTRFCQYDDGEDHWENFKMVRWVREQDEGETVADGHCGEAEKVAGEKSLGRRLTMLWPAEKQWFYGTIIKFHFSGQHIIEWDDREISIHDLSCERFQWV
jgi:hypothetical protein